MRKTFPNRTESNVFSIFDIVFAGGFPESSRYNTRYRRRELGLEKGISRYWGRPIKADTLKGDDPANLMKDIYLHDPSSRLAGVPGETEARGTFMLRGCLYAQSARRTRSLSGGRQPPGIPGLRRDGGG